MNSGDSLSDEDRLQSPLHEAVGAVCAETIPDQVVERAVTRALELATPSKCRVECSRPHRQPWLVAARRWTILAAGAAAVVAVVVFWNHSPNSVLADVVDAVAKQAWMRATGKGPNHSDVEIWYSPRDGIIATRQGKDLIYINLRQETIEVHEHAEEGKSFLARLPIESEQRELFASQEQTFQALFFGNPTNAFRGGSRQVASHTKKTVREGNAAFIEYRLTSKATGNAKPMETVLRVDPETQLPVSWKSMIDNTQLYSCQVEYPAEGPQSVYAMGVPRGVKIVDQAPSADLKRILAAWRAGRTRFDSYRAVVVESRFSDHRAGGFLIYQVWRKGLKWRIELLHTPSNLRRSNVKDLVPDDADPKTWWLACGRNWKKMPKNVSDGTIEIRLKHIPAEPVQEDPENPRYMLITSVEPERTNAFDVSTDDPRPDRVDLMPEFDVYPMLSGRGGWLYQTTIDPQPTSGPEGTLLVESLNRNPSKLPGRFRGARYWADPACGYVVRQMQWLETGKADDSMHGLVEMQQFELSPSGLWYPLVVRHAKNYGRLDDGEMSDTYSRYYLDFEADIPDELFDVHQWGPIE